MAEAKTKPTKQSVEEYLANIPDESRRSDCERLITLIKGVTKEDAVLWGTAIIGFGSYHYKYASGREGDTMRIGLSSRKEHIVLYGVIFYGENTQLLEVLGKTKQGKGCLYIQKLADIDLGVLERMIREAYSKPALYQAA